MAQDLFRVELGLADDNIHYLSGSGAPAGTLATAAPVGSKWSDTANGDTYTKTGSGWLMLATGGDAAALQNEVDAIETAVGLNTNGTITFGGTPGNYLATDSLRVATQKIDAATTAAQSTATAAAGAVAQEIIDRGQAITDAATAQALVDGAQDTAIGGKVAKAGDTMTGNLAFGGTMLPTGLKAPVDGTDAANKNYVDNAVVGISWKAPVNSVGATNPLTATTGDRFLNTTDKKIYTATATDTWNAGDTPADGWACFDKTNEQGYIFNGTSWDIFTGGGMITAGVGLAKTGNQLDVNLGAGVAQLPSDEVGIDFRPNSGLWLTEDGLTASTATAAQIAVNLDGTTLSMGVNGLRASAATMTAISDAAAAIAQEIIDRGTAVGNEATARNDADVLMQTDITALQTKLNHARTVAQALATTSTVFGGVSVDVVEAAKWIVSVRGTGADAAKKQVVEVLAIHNGTAVADATAVDYTVYAKLKIGTLPGLTFVVNTSGTGVTQNMNLTVTATNAVDVAVIREVVFFAA